MNGHSVRFILPIWLKGDFQVVVSEYLLSELDEVWKRPRLRKYINEQDALELLEQLRNRGEIVTLSTIPPQCRDPRDNPVLATAIDGKANAIVSGDADLRADDTLRQDMARYSVQLWGVDRLFQEL
ncbi:MAG TPA: putative toxin-antitoxin system toxin component, PIN family, partial [Anaerolineae bacterium]